MTSNEFNDSNSVYLSCDKDLKSIPLLGLTPKDLLALVKEDDLDLQRIQPKDRTLLQKLLLGWVRSEQLR